MFGNIEDRKSKREEGNMLAELLEGAMIESGSQQLKAAAMLGREVRMFDKDLKRLMHFIDRPEEEAAQIYNDAYEYVRLAHEGLRTFMQCHVEKHGDGVIDDPA